MKWAFKQQEATSQAKGHRKKKEKQHERRRKKSMRKWRRNNYCRQTMNVTRGRLSLRLSLYCLSSLHSSTYCCFVLVRPLCCSVYFETYSRCVMWFHFCPFVVVLVVSIVVALISQPDKEENSQRPPELSLQGDSSNCWRVAQEVLQAQKQLDLFKKRFNKWATGSVNLS